MQIVQCAILNALWDLWAKCEGKPVWRLVYDMSPEELVQCMDFRYMSDVLTPAQAIEMLRELEPTKEKRLKEVTENQAVPGYNTSIGWLGFCKSVSPGRS